MSTVSNVSDRHASSSGDVSEDRQPLYILFRLYTLVMESVHPYQILLSVQQDLCGLKQCALKGPNEDRTPSHRIADYYSWMAWKKFTLLLADKTWTVARFKEVAIKNYISTAHKYLCRLNVFDAHINKPLSK